MSDELIREILDYIEQTEVTIDSEWGDARSLKQLLAEDEMPDLYKKIKQLIEHSNQQEG